MKKYDIFLFDADDTLYGCTAVKGFEKIYFANVVIMMI